ncbi:MAG: DUF6370 family protein [Pirellulaceae bacterium]
MLRQTAVTVLALLLLAGCQPVSEVKQNKTEKAPSNIPSFGQIVEASCGQCQFGMEGDGCTLAVRIDGETYYVDGSSIDDHGDAHGDDGLCNCVRRARVQGEVVDGKFVASVFEVLPDDDGE